MSAHLMKSPHFLTVKTKPGQRKRGCFVTTRRCYISPKAFRPSFGHVQGCKPNLVALQDHSPVITCQRFGYIRSRSLYFVSLLACSGPQQTRGFFVLSVLLKFQQFLLPDGYQEVQGKKTKSNHGLSRRRDRV